MPVSTCSIADGLAVCWGSLESGAASSIFIAWLRLLSEPLCDHCCFAGSGGCHSAALGRGASLFSGGFFCGSVACLPAACSTAFTVDETCADGCHSAGDDSSAGVTGIREDAGFVGDGRRTAGTGDTRLFTSTTIIWTYQAARLLPPFLCISLLGASGFTCRLVQDCKGCIILLIMRKKGMPDCFMLTGMLLVTRILRTILQRLKNEA